MPIITDFEFELRSFIFGGDSDTYPVYSMDGLFGSPDFKTQDTDNQMQHGVTAGKDVYGPKRVSWLVDVLGVNETAKHAAMRTMVATFRPADGIEVLSVRVLSTPETIMYVYGRPRGAPVSTFGVTQRLGKVRMNPRFLITDPFFYGAGVTGAATTGQTVTNAGDATTKRSTIKVVGNGSTPTLVNTTDSSGTITWNTTLGNTVQRIVNLFDKSVTDGAGNGDYRSEILNSSTWFSWQVGANTLTVTGCTSAQVSHQPAYHS